MRQISKGTNLTQDRHILSQQIRLITQLLETDKTYYASVLALLGHDLYMRIHDELDRTTQSCNDPDRTLNYVTTFLQILKKYYKIMDSKISAHLTSSHINI